MRDYRTLNSYMHRATKKPEKKKRKVAKGELLLTSEPFVYVINNEHRFNYCNHCIAMSKDKILHACKMCRVPWYCSEDCERMAWDSHKYECILLKRCKPHIPPDFVRLMARLIFRLRGGGERLVEQYTEKDGRRFRDLMNHYADIKDNEECQSDVEFVKLSLRRYIGDSYMPNDSNFLGIYGRVVVNRFCLLSPTMEGIGSALYLAGSILDHACSPNCSFYFSGRKVHIRALEDMEDFDFNKCRISYVDPVCSRTYRREELFKKWFFWCDCKLCRDPDRIKLETSMLCGNPLCEAPVYVPEKEDPRYPTTPTCGECGLAVDEVVERRYKDVFQYTKKKLADMSTDSPDLEMCSELLRRQELFHPMHVWRIRTLDYAFNAAVSGGCWSLVYDYGHKNLEGMRYYYPPGHPSLAMFLLKLGKAELYLKMFKDGLRHLGEAEPILRTAFGDLHPLVTEELVPLGHLANEDIDIALERRMKVMEKKLEQQKSKESERRLQRFLDIGKMSAAS